MKVLKVFFLIVFLILAVWVQAEQKNAPDLTEEETYGPLPPRGGPRTHDRGRRSKRKTNKEE